MSIPGLQAVERHEAQVRVTLAFAITGGCIGFVLALYLAYLFPGIPRSVLLVEWAGAIFFAGGLPFIARTIRESPLQFATLPSPLELLEQTAGVNQRRNVRIEDLLGGAVRADLRDRVVLLTGAAGSIGSELARQIAPFGPARLVLLDQSESELCAVHLELREAYPDLELMSVICDITNAGRLAQVYAQHRPDYVVHAAAYKHVPLLETDILEAVRNNVLGTLLVATTAVRYGASKVLLVSTDKAIKPSTVMGATKRVAERIIFGLPNLHRSGTDFRAVRFGNVLTSKGRVEAAQLVLQAGSLSETAGAIAMLEMGEPVRIEEQVSALEETVPTSSEKIRISQTAESAEPELLQKLSRLFTYLDVGDREGLRATLCELVPECVRPLQESGAARERRPGVQRHALAPDPLVTDRRQAVACRRKTARVGGRRRTDTEMLLATGSPAAPDGC
jgi:hypothetical protein